MRATSLVRDGTVVACQLTHYPNSDRMFLKPISSTFSFVVTVVLFSCERTRPFEFLRRRIKTYINNQQKENSSSTSKHKRLAIVPARQSVAQVFNASSHLVATRPQLSCKETSLVCNSAKSQFFCIKLV